MEYLDGIVSIIWNENFWLPPNTKWADINPDSNSNINYPDIHHLWYPIPLSVLLLMLRYLLENIVIAPIGRFGGIPDTKKVKAQVNPTLEDAYSRSKHPTHQEIVQLTKKIDMTERQIERWIRIRSKQDKPTTLIKFCENTWRFIYYTTAFIFGVFVLQGKPWLWDITECWKSYPHQGYTSDIWWYYMIQLSFYWSLCISQFYDVKRKDFWQMFIHHLATISLLCFSWICNFHRVGSLVLVVHDAADCLLDLAKLLKYMRWQKTCDIIFAVFTIVWIITRDGLFPFWIIRSTIFDSPGYLEMFPAYYVFNFLLLVLFVLHILWTYLIFRVACSTFKAGELQNDVRSSSSDISEQD